LTADLQLGAPIHGFEEMTIVLLQRDIQTGAQQAGQSGRALGQQLALEGGLS
jgi:hypothetical protein